MTSRLLFTKKKKKSLLWFSFYINEPSALLDPTANMKQANKQTLYSHLSPHPEDKFVCSQKRDKYDLYSNEDHA